MTTYAEAGVNVSAGDLASEAAYKAAKATFPVRAGLIGEPVVLEGGFTGLLDMGDYYLVQNNDGVGTKSEIARRVGDFSSLGYDLLAMVADDAVCVGAELISLSNTIDIDRVDAAMISSMMNGLKKACIEQKVVIPGGEIAEMSDLIKGVTWNATGVGIVAKDKFISSDKVAAGDKIIGLLSRGFRSNGLTLVRHILSTKLGENWHNVSFSSGRTWGEAALVPSLIYHDFVLSLTGRYGQQGRFAVHGIAHVTGGGIANNLRRVLKKNRLGALLDNLPTPHPQMLRLQELGEVKDKEAYQAWNMGVGMLLVVAESDAPAILAAAAQKGFAAQTVGTVTAENGVRYLSRGFYAEGEISVSD